MNEIYDLIIVGGGPAGLAAAIYAGRSERKTLLFEKGSYGGRINDTYDIIASRTYVRVLPLEVITWIWVPEI